MIALGASVILMVIGIIMIAVGKSANIDPNVNKALYVVGLILFFVGILFLVLNLLGIAI
ncbi:MAG: hypothetical protein K0S93_188 [Nitrososphaeraceae archaeon]|jgi:hypothetical protein|nr:hypothetical protein [Nitrososphaeraceae archaeon]